MSVWLNVIKGQKDQIVSFGRIRHLIAAESVHAKKD
jgi:hypothetical protein